MDYIQLLASYDILEAKFEAVQAERDALAANLAEHQRLHAELNAILHPEGNGPAAPSLCDLVSYVRSDRQALAAQVEALRNLLDNVRRGEEFIVDSSIMLGVDCDLADEIDAALKATQQHHLRELRAEAGRAGFIAGARIVSDSCTNAEDEWYDSQIISASDQYADQIRNAKDGE